MRVFGSCVLSFACVALGRIALRRGNASSGSPVRLSGSGECRGDAKTTGVGGGRLYGCTTSPTPVRKSPRHPRRPSCSTRVPRRLKSRTLFAHALADALAVHELRPRIEDGQVAIFLLLPRRCVLGLPIRQLAGLIRKVLGRPHLTNCVFVFRSDDQARNYGKRLARPTLIAYLGSTQSDTTLTKTESSVDLYVKLLWR